jgi:hypothetical protein
MRFIGLWDRSSCLLFKTRRFRGWILSLSSGGTYSGGWKLSKIAIVIRGPLSLVSKIEELLVRNSSGNGLEIREYGRGDPLRWPCNTLHPQNLALTSPTSGSRSVGIVRSRTQATEYRDSYKGKWFSRNKSLWSSDTFSLRGLWMRSKIAVNLRYVLNVVRANHIAAAGDRTLCFLWGTDKPTELRWVLNKRQDDG